MSQSPLKPLIYTEHVAVMLRKETVEKLIQIAASKGYAPVIDHHGRTLKQPKRGISRLVREILEEATR
jgi:hypothetical protein